MHGISIQFTIMSIIIVILGTVKLQSAILVVFWRKNLLSCYWISPPTWPPNLCGLHLKGWSGAPATEASYWSFTYVHQLNQHIFVTFVIGAAAPGSTFFFGGGGNIFGHQCPKNVDLQLFKINIWLKLLQRLKRMLLGSNKYHECSFNVFSRVERGAGNPGRFYHVCKSQPEKFDLSPGIGYFGRPHLGSRQRSGSKNLKLRRTDDLCVTFMYTSNSGSL